MAKYDAGGAFGGALSGGALGSTFGPIGTGVGALFGGIGGLFGSKKKKVKPKKFDTMNPQQKELFDQYISSLRGEGPFSGMYNFDSEGYNNVFNESVAAPAYQQFQENIIPSISGQFRKGNLANSSYFGSALSNAGRNVQQQLDAQRNSNIFAGQQQAQMNKQNAINNILNTQTFAMSPGQQQAPSMLNQILGSVAPAAGEWFADYLKSSRSSSPSSSKLSTSPAVY